MLIKNKFKFTLSFLSFISLVFYNLNKKYFLISNLLLSEFITKSIILILIIYGSLICVDLFNDITIKKISLLQIIFGINIKNKK